MRVHIWGTRGSIATPGPETIHFGGNTSCVELETNDGSLFILDCGTGARLLGEQLGKSRQQPVKGTILISHAHWDHIQGFPFLTPIFSADNEFVICGPKTEHRTMEQVLAGQMEFTYFPVDLKQLSATLSYHDLVEGTYNIANARITTQYLNHPAVTLGYRIEADGVTVMYLCDHEPFSDFLWRSDAEPGKLSSILHEGDRRHARFMRDADLVIHDSQYTLEQYSARKNWGHSHYEYVVGIASAAGVKQLLLTHHDPNHNDAFISEVELRAQKVAEKINSPIQVSCAYEGFDLSIEALDRIDADVRQKVNRNGLPARTVRILVADDDPDILNLVEAVLKTDEVSILLASNGQEALQKVKEFNPDLLILDVMMPELAGFEVLRILRSRPETADLPVLMLTAKDDEKHIREGFESGANDYLTKPFMIPQLTARVRACLERLGK